MPCRFDGIGREGYDTSYRELNDTIHVKYDATVLLLWGPGCCTGGVTVVEPRLFG